LRARNTGPSCAPSGHTSTLGTIHHRRAQVNQDCGPQNLEQGPANGEVRTSAFCGSLLASPKLLSVGGFLILRLDWLPFPLANAGPLR
jgi:hypothetical protein